MKPYYQDDACTIYHGDCREVLPRVGNAAVILTDPPYNLGINYGAGTNDSNTDYESWCAGWFAECRRIAPVVLVSPGIANLGLWYRLAPPDWVLAWHKPAAMGRCPLGFNNWEPILSWGKPTRQATDVVTAGIIPDRSLEGHPCPKPLKWASALLSRFGLPGALVLDPFMGSGTTLRAAKDAGSPAIGIEIEERYCEIAAKRLAQEVLPLEVA